MISPRMRALSAGAMSVPSYDEAAIELAETATRIMPPKIATDAIPSSENPLFHRRATRSAIARTRSDVAAQYPRSIAARMSQTTVRA